MQATHKPRRKRDKMTSTDYCVMPLPQDALERIEAIACDAGVSRAFVLEAAVRFFARFARAGTPALGIGPLVHLPGCITVASDFYRADKDLIAGGSQLCTIELLENCRFSWHRIR